MNYTAFPNIEVARREAKAMAVAERNAEIAHEDERQPIEENFAGECDQIVRDIERACDDLQRRLTEALRTL